MAVGSLAGRLECVASPESKHTKNLPQTDEKRCRCVTIPTRDPAPESGLWPFFIPIQIPDSFKICNDLAIIISGSESSSAHSNWLKERAEDYGSQTRERLLTGFLVSAVDYLDALKLREKILEEFLCDVFSEVDVLHLPVVPIPVPTLAESNIQNNPGFIEYLSLLGHCTRPFDFLGMPALSLPAGMTDNAMPTGLQLVAPPFEESLLFRAGHAYEREIKWSFPENNFQ